MVNYTFSNPLIKFICFNVYCYYFFQKYGVNMSNIVNNSRRPISIIEESIHFAASGKELYVNSSPITSTPSPVLLIDVKA